MKKIVFLLALTCLVFGFDVNFKSFGADFKQSVSSNNVLIEYNGSFIITQTKAFWDYKSPTPKQIYGNENELVILEPDLEQAIFTNLDKVPNLSVIFANAKQKSKNEYEAKYENITYTIKLKNDEISSIYYKDELDNNVLIEFFNQKRDFKVSNELFKAKIPVHFDRVR